MISLKPNDFNVLNQYCFVESGRNQHNKELLGVRWDREQGRWTQQLVIIEREKATLWNVLLSLIGRGPLRRTTVSLHHVCSYLTRYQWEVIKEEASQTQAFKTVCHLANRQLKYQRIELFKRVSEANPGEFPYWNPALNGRFLLDLMHHLHPSAQKIELRFKKTKEKVPLEHALSKTLLKCIEIGEPECIEIGEPDEKLDVTPNYPPPTPPILKNQSVRRVLFPE